MSVTSVADRHLPWLPAYTRDRTTVGAGLVAGVYELELIILPIHIKSGEVKATSTPEDGRAKTGFIVCHDVRLVVIRVKRLSTPTIGAAGPVPLGVQHIRHHVLIEAI